MHIFIYINISNYLKVKLRMKQKEQPMQKAQNKNSSNIILHAQ
jgi:hypothetical protein